jgi:hypothetical protein
MVQTEGPEPRMLKASEQRVQGKAPEKEPQQLKTDRGFRQLTCDLESTGTLYIGTLYAKRSLREINDL